jgi:hypothetical protein
LAEYIWFVGFWLISMPITVPVVAMTDWRVAHPAKSEHDEATAEAASVHR